MCSAGCAIVMPAPGFIVGWQTPQSLLVGCGAGGGAPWHESHCDCEPSTVVHHGSVAAPPLRVAPWQYELEQVVPLQVVPVPSAPNTSSAGAEVSS
jgi:hypothetical protein